MLTPSPRVLDRLIRDRQDTLRPSPSPSQARAAVARTGLRVRIGRALIVAGSALSGERVERPARPPACPRPA